MHGSGVALAARSAPLCLGMYWGRNWWKLLGERTYRRHQGHKVTQDVNEITTKVNQVTIYIGPWSMNTRK